MYAGPRRAGDHLVGIKRVESRSHCRWHVDGGATNGLWRVVADCGALQTRPSSADADPLPSSADPLPMRCGLEKSAAAGGWVQVQIEEIPDPGPCVPLLRRVVRFTRRRGHAAIE